MVKRILIVAVVLAAIFVMAAPALAYDGFRSDYSNAALCQSCHDAGNGAGAPVVYPDWLTTAHAMVGTAEIDPVTGELAGGTANAEPIADGPGCAGCHSSNYDPAKHTPLPDPIPTDDIAPAYPSQNTAGDDAFSEPFVGCSACHRNIQTGHNAPIGTLANADVCGQCHSRYSNSVVPYENYDGTSALRQYTLGNFNPIGTSDTTPAWSPLPITDFLNIPSADSPQQMIYYKIGETTLPYNARAHEEGATQYNEWSHEGHAGALDALKAIGQGNNPACLECHSTDYVLSTEAGDSAADAAANAKFGVTCVGCHAPHTPSAATSTWNEERNPQLIAPKQQLCVRCHNAELPAQANGQPGVATPGSSVHHPMNEMMNGTGAIDVPQGSPSVHKGKCVQCHMPPTSYDRNGMPQTGANHAFRIIEPEVAKDALTTAPIAGLVRNMPYSACTTCHSRPGDDQAVWLQNTLDDRQAAMHNWDDQVTAALGAAAGKLGFKGADDAAKRANANKALNAIGSAHWTSSQLTFQKAFTNQQYIESEGSWGIHNWDYARTVILTAKSEAQSVASVKVVTLKASKTSVKVNAKVKLTGRCNTLATGKVKLQKKFNNGKWTTWKSVSLKAGSFSASMKMTKKGTYHFRAKVAASATQKGGTSSSVKVVVKK